MPKWFYFTSHKSEKGNTVVVMTTVPASTEPATRTIKLANGKEVECAGKSLFTEKPEFAYGIATTDPGLTRGELAMKDGTPDADGRLF